MNNSLARKKILFVITKSNWGGAQRYVYDLATNLSPKEFEIVVATGLPAEQAGGSGPLVEKLRKAGIRTTSLPRLGRDVNPFFDIASLVDLYKLFKKERPDIIHLNSSKAGFLGALAARLCNTFSRMSAVFPLNSQSSVLCSRVIFTSHGWPFNEDRPWLARKLFLILSWLTVVFTHRTIAVSEAIAGAMNRAPFVSKKISVVYVGIRPTKPIPPLMAREIILGTRAEKFDAVPWIGTIAELHRSKGLGYMIEALTRVKHLPWVYVVIGDGQERIVLEKQIQESGLADRIFLVGARSHAATLLGAFDLFVLPSITEAFGYVLLEAGYAELPVIASAVGGIPEIIEREKSGILVPSKNPPALARALDRALRSTLPMELGATLHARVLKDFSFESFLQNTISVYRTNS